MTPQPLTDYEIVAQFTFLDTTECVLIGQRPQGFWEMHYVDSNGSILDYRSADIQGAHAHHHQAVPDYARPGHNREPSAERGEHVAIQRRK